MKTNNENVIRSIREKPIGEAELTYLMEDEIFQIFLYNFLIKKIDMVGFDLHNKYDSQILFERIGEEPLIYRLYE